MYIEILLWCCVLSSSLFMISALEQTQLILTINNNAKKNIKTNLMSEKKQPELLNVKNVSLKSVSGEKEIIDQIYKILHKNKKREDVRKIYELELTVAFWSCLKNTFFTAFFIIEFPLKLDVLFSQI